MVYSPSGKRAATAPYQQAMNLGRELRILASVTGHFGLFGFEQTCLAAVDQVFEDRLVTGT